MSGGKLIGLTVYYDTADPAATGWWAAKYRVHWLGSNPSWGKREIDDEDGGAGNDCDQIDMIEVAIIGPQISRCAKSPTICCASA